MPKEDSQQFDVRRYLSIIERRKYLALSVGLVVLSIFTWGSFLLSRTYEASSTVSIEKDTVLKPLMQGVGVSGSNEDKLINLKSDITSRSIIEKVVTKLGFNINDKGSGQFNARIEGIRQNLDITVRGNDRETNLFNITYKGKDPKKVADVVNTIVGIYIDENIHSRRSDTSEAYEFIQNQVQEYKVKLEESDRNIREFKEKNPNLVPQSETTLLTRLEGQQSARIEAEIRLKELVRRKENLQKQLAGEKELTVAFVTREGSPQARLSYLNNQFMLLTAKYTEHYPEVIKIKSEIEELKKQIAQAKESRTESPGSETAAMNPIFQQLKEDLAKTDAEVESLKARTSELSKQQQESQRIFGRMPKEQEEWTKLQRDRNVYQQIYDQLLQKLENAKVSKELEFADKGERFKIIDYAMIPLFPVKPDRVKMIFLGILLGIVSGIGTALGLEYLDHSFKDEDSIESSIQLPVLAAIPRIVTEADELAAKRLDLKVFVASGAYLFVVCLVLIKELLSRYMGIKIFNF
jgi:polysaccharide chain length determinant protein (PEP-CTERM system associated)